MSVEIITPQVELIDLTKLTNTTCIPTEQLAEQVGRMCYNSYDKLNDKSHVKFNGHSAKKGHRSIFEFSNIRLSLFPEDQSAVAMIYETLEHQNWLKYETLTNVDREGYTKYVINVYGSIRAFIEMMEMIVDGQCDNNPPVNLFLSIFAMVERLSKNIFHNWATYNELQSFMSAMSHSASAISIQFKDITNLTRGKNKYKKLLVKITSDKGLHNEIVRHRPASYMSESQRYVRYGIGEKSSPMKVCIATNHRNDDEYVRMVINGATAGFDHYCQLLEAGYPAQQARAVLPVGVAMTYFVYADMEEWNHIFRLRAAKDALPMAQEVANDIWHQMINKRVF